MLSIALAISGGVDSMALAYLCSQVHRADPWLKVSDHEVGEFRGMIVDHRMRPNSRAEAAAVQGVLRNRMGITAEILRLSWQNHAPGGDPSKLPNVESVARKLRYRALGRHAQMWCAVSILLAHHEDDQAETVLMRLLGGHGVRGLRGMRPATDIPECNDMHGIYQSGVLDEIRKSNPYYRSGVSGKRRKWLKHYLKAELNSERLTQELQEGYDFERYSHPFMSYEVGEPFKRPKRVLPLEPMEIEDGGVCLYRPLLGFSKERLIATCVENKIPWFEDATNTDPTLTMRNAVRHLFKGYELPKALQKPAILDLAKRCQARVAAEEAEAERLIRRIVVGDQAFEPNTGTLVVQLPDLKSPTVPSRERWSRLRQERRRTHHIHIAAMAIQKLLFYITPEQTLTPLSDLETTVIRLFPSLAEHGTPYEPKAFTICGVILRPIPGEPLRWYLARAPYDNKLPNPELKIRKARPSRRWLNRPSKWAFSPWTTFGLYDNRWWVSLQSRVPFELSVAPLQTEHMKEFRNLLSDRGRTDLAAMLKDYAPGKVRYTLPAIYVRGNIIPIIRTVTKPEQPTFHQSHKPEQLNSDELDVPPEDILNDNIRARKEAKGGVPVLIPNDRCTRKDLKRMRDRKMRLVAVPTLGVSIPGLENWIGWRFRYRKVNVERLQRCRTADDERMRNMLVKDRRKRLAIARRRARLPRAW